MKRSLLVALLLLCGCAQPFESRVAGRLAGAGIPRGMAECMAGRWVDRLSVFQLQKIQRLTNDIGEQYKGRTLTPLVLVERLRAVDDPEIMRVVSASVPACALRI
jgi:hypothetical protein